MPNLLFEARRKFIHILGLGYLLFYWLIFKLFQSSKIAILYLLSVLILFVVIDFFRITGKKKIPVFHILFRTKEENSLGGQVYYILGMILALCLFDFKIAFAVILMTVLGDAAAAMFGIAFGKHWIKSLEDTAWEGVIAEFTVDIIIGYFIIGNWYIIIPMALMATVVETIFPHIDDNLAIPIFAGFVGQGLSLLL
ncbi:MAG: CTP--2,3-di-O-geranylgeranyl-sn-glycero-1-phosphate cytidyltransferase [Nanoarchaeota archaeon]|nr:CTP--2,3-di-O-geranylgeranyl-sn-glycero-1-phosphate cytidyltransferase [Nanoarchaeota archaeon]